MNERSTVIELSDGTSEHVAFFDGLFGVTHLPRNEPVGSLVLCSPLFSEFLKNNRREVLLGRRLAADGFAVQRFHYRGTGNSMGSPDALTIDSMNADAGAAAAHLTNMSGIHTPAVLGTLMASFPAVEIAAPESRIVLWEPTTDGRRYFRDLIRTLLIVGMSNGLEMTSADLDAEFEMTGQLEIAGFSLPRSLRDSARERKLGMPEGTGPVLIVQLDRRAEVSRSTARLVQDIERSGRPVSVAPIGASEAWWFHRDVDKLRPEEDATLADAMITPTVGWLTGEAQR